MKRKAMGAGSEAAIAGAVGLLALLLALALATPALADSGTALGTGQSIVGVVYRGWTDAECKSAFGNYRYIITSIDSLGLITGSIKDARGPLVQKGVDTGCYCGKDDQGTDWIMSEDQQTCMQCKFYDRNALYYTDTNAEPSAVLKSKGADVGCRCAKKEGNKDFDKVDNNVCKYVDKTEQNAKCQALFGTTGVRVCANTAGETELGYAQGIRCCCEPNTEKKQSIATATPGGYKCEALAKGVTGNDNTCSKEVENKGLGPAGSAVECPASFKDFNPLTATQQQRDDYNSRFITTAQGSGGQVMCCCGSGYIQSGGKCLKDIDECGAIVPGSVKQGRADAGTIKVGDSYGTKQWQKDKLDAIQKAKISACYCKKNYIPMDKMANPKKTDGSEDTLNVLDTCVEASSCADIALGSVPSTDKNANPALKVGPGWEENIATAIANLKLECNCPNGTIAYDSNSNGANDVCAFNNMRCMDSTDLSNFMYVGICTSQMNSVPFSIDFSEKGPVGLVDDQDLSVKDASHKIADIGAGIIYGVTRAMGFRDIMYGLERISGCDSDKPTSKDDFAGYTRWMACLSTYPCDMMPTIDTTTGLQSGFLKMGGQVYYDTRKELKAAEGIGKNWGEQVSAIETQLQDAGSSMEGAWTTLGNLQKDATEAAGKYTSDTKDPKWLEFAEAQKAAKGDYLTLQDRILDAKKKLTTVRKSIAEYKKGVEVTDVSATAAAESVEAGLTKGNELLDSLNHFVTMPSGASAGLDLGNMQKTAENVGKFMSTSTEAGTDLGRATESITAAVEAVGIDLTDLAKAAKTGSKWWASLMKKTSPAIDTLYDIPVINVMSKITLKSFKFAGKALGWIGLAYSVVDFATSAVSRTISTDLVMTPGHKVYEVQTDKPFVVKASKASGSGYDPLYAVKTVNINLNSGVGLPWHVLDAKLTSDTLTSPPPIDGLTYKCMCTGGASCGLDKKLSGCTCYPVSNSIDVQVGSKNAISLSGI